MMRDGLIKVIILGEGGLVISGGHLNVNGSDAISYSPHIHMADTIFTTINGAALRDSRVLIHDGRDHFPQGHCRPSPPLPSLAC